MQKYFTVIFILLTLVFNSFGQLSQGGFPLEIPNLKSTSLLSEKVIKMPSFKLEKEDSADGFDNYKSLKFAHSFPVSISSENSGTWYEADGFKIWQVELSSEEAYSLYVTFSKYYIPEGARLFVFDPEKKVILGAFTSKNNKPYKKLSIRPLPGDNLIVQYEEPLDAAFNGELEIGEIYHDYKGIFSSNNRWDRRLSQSCNVDVNCEFESETDDQRRAVCVVLAGKELGTGTLLNNVMKDGKPYLLSAYHVYMDNELAQTALYFFNYESPFCTGLNGSDIQTVSGSVKVAAFDSVDLMLVKLSEMPPPSYRPFLAGWDASIIPPSNSYIIHHPNGDTKKISYDSGKCDSARYNKNFINYGHWKVFDWEVGTTEGGSSGGALFNKDKRVIGILSGGNASCESITYDLFSRFDKMWDYRSKESEQLKHWLDPQNTGTLQINGFDPYKSTSSECTIISNFMVEDTAVVLPTEKGTGFITGNNSDGISEIAERFTGYSKAVISGISVGVSKINILDKTKATEITIRIYTGDSLPDFAVKQFKFPIKNFTEEAMNYLDFSESIKVEGNFFISIVIPEGDTISFFQSALRPLVAENTMLVLQNGTWKSISQYNGKDDLGASLLMQVVICDASTQPSTDTTQYATSFFRIYPNPASDYFVVEFKERAPSYELRLFDMMGKMLMNKSFENRMYGEIDLSGIQHGIYLIQVSNGTDVASKRIIIN